jgi:hypothetical protein
MSKKIIIILVGIVAVLLIAAGGVYSYQKSFGIQQKACTLEAKICSDGTAVGRSGPNCEFAACPVASGAVKACVDSGGTAITISCCNAVNDFPNSCISNICGCLPADSKNIKICNCGESKCFNGEGCVSPNLNITIYCTNNNCAPQEVMAGAGTLVRGCYRDLNECAKDAGWQTYQNEKLSFELKLPPTGNGYKATEGEYPSYSYVGFSFSGAHQPFEIFKIVRYSKEQLAAAGGKLLGKVLSQTDEATLVCDGCCDSKGDFTGGGQFDNFQKARCQEAPQIIATLATSTIK